MQKGPKVESIDIKSYWKDSILSGRQVFETICTDAHQDFGITIHQSLIKFPH